MYSVLVSVECGARNVTRGRLGQFFMGYVLLLLLLFIYFFENIIGPTVQTRSGAQVTNM